MRSTLRATLLTFIVVAGCSPIASPIASTPMASRSLAPTERPAPSTPSPSPSLLPPPTPRPSLVPAGVLAWDPLETEGGALRSITAALSFRDSYIVVGSDGDGLDRVARSTDGRHWDVVPIGLMVEPCPGYVPRPDSSVYVATTDGNQIVLAGIEYAMDVSPCGTWRAVTWVSTDGRTWQRSKGFGAVHGYGEASAVWAIPGGWEVLVRTIDGPLSVWRSSDGLQWQQVHVLDPADWQGLSVTIGASAGGTRLLTLFNGQFGSVGTIGGLRAGESRLESSIDGLEWTTVDLTLPIGRGVTAGWIVGPGSAGSPTWLLAAEAQEQELAMTYTSPDLLHWEQGTFPRNRIDHLAFTRFGFIASGATHCPAGGDCTPQPAQYLSTDGLHWTPFASSVGNVVMVDGPVGVLAVSDPGFKVWRLRP